MTEQQPPIPESIIRATPRDAAEPAHLTRNGAVIVCVRPTSASAPGHTAGSPRR